jgi:hypothetical protein
MLLVVIQTLVIARPTMSWGRSIDTTRMSGPDSEKRIACTVPTGKMTTSTIIRLVLGGLAYFWIVFALIFALFTNKHDRPYYVRVKDALVFRYH